MKTRRTISVAASLLLLVSSLATAQDSGRTSVVNENAWYMYFGDHKIGDSRFGFHFDGQHRIEFLFGRRDQLLLRPGLNFDVSENLQVTGGYAYINTNSPEGSPPNFDVPEHRIWEQVLLKQRLGSTRLTHRYRFEQRYVGKVRPSDMGEGEVDGYAYKNRIRYFVKGTIPFSESSRYFASFYNEVLIGFGHNVKSNIFDQNRAYAAIGIKLGAHESLELGYLLHIVQRSSGDVIDYNHTLQVGFFSSRPIG